MNIRLILVLLILSLFSMMASVAAEEIREISDDGLESATPRTFSGDEQSRSDRDVLFNTSPDWQNSLRMQVGGLYVADVDNDGRQDVVVGCYQSGSYPPYTDWHNLIYFNTGTELEADPSWVSTDMVSTGDVKVALINDDEYPDVFAANGGSSMSASVIYWGGPDGPSQSPGWHSTEPGGAWNNYALPCDFDHDGDIDIITANQGNSQYDPSRPIYIFSNIDGALGTTPTWQSAESSLQGYLAVADFDHNGWEDLAVSKWSGYESGIYSNNMGVFETTPIWTTGDTDSDKGVAWADVDGDTWPDLALGHDPTQLWTNDLGSLSLEWASSATYFGHSDITFCDVDRDGDPDLAETHFSDGKVHIYLNDAGVLQANPSWTYDSPSVGTAIAFGDINGDNWPDLVVGNSGEPCVKVFYAQVTTGLSDSPAAFTPDFSNYPNPFNPTTTFVCTMPAAGAATLEIFDISGALISTVFRGHLAAGEQTISWDAADSYGDPAVSGIYLARLTTPGGAVGKKIILLK
ncbi:MAG: T9SS type A sorting domain-containing protein [bacterium]|nr:T9SS type A sorting domain-containing protein [bacterium]